MQDYESIPMEKSPKGWWQAQVPEEERRRQVVAVLLRRRGRLGSAGRLQRPCREPERHADREQGVAQAQEAKRRGGPVRRGRRTSWGENSATAVSGSASAWGRAPCSRSAARRRPPSMPSTTRPTRPRLRHRLGGSRSAAPTIGMAFNPSWAVSLEGRNQFILRPKGVSSTVAASGAHAVVLRLLYIHETGAHPVVLRRRSRRGEGIREVVKVPNRDPSKSAFQDTVLVGPYLVAGHGRTHLRDLDQPVVHHPAQRLRRVSQGGHGPRPEPRHAGELRRQLRARRGSPQTAPGVGLGLRRRRGRAPQGSQGTVQGGVPGRVQSRVNQGGGVGTERDRAVQAARRVRR